MTLIKWNYELEWKQTWSMQCQVIKARWKNWQLWVIGDNGLCDRHCSVLWCDFSCSEDPSKVYKLCNMYMIVLYREPNLENVPFSFITSWTHGYLQWPPPTLCPGQHPHCILFPQICSCMCDSWWNQDWFMIAWLMISIWICFGITESCFQVKCARWLRPLWLLSYYQWAKTPLGLFMVWWASSYWGIIWWRLILVFRIG